MSEPSQLGWIVWQIHAGDAVLSILGTAALVALRKITAMLGDYINHVNNIAEVVDQHSSVLVRLTGKGTKFKKVARDRPVPVIQYVENE